jgi:uncharacterized lipoprotein
MVKRIFLVGLVCLVLAACATAPMPRQIQNSFPIDQPFEKVWQAVIETFAELNLPIMNMEKASGLITTDWISFRGQKDEAGYCSCGKAGFPFSEVERKGKFNVYVKKIEEASCEIKVNSSFEATAAYQDAIKSISCISTGNLEKEIYELVLAKTK